MKKTPLQFFESLFKVIENFFVFFGIDAYTPGYNPGLREAFFSLVMMVAIPSIFYTAYDYDLATALKSFTMLGIILQGNVKYLTFIALRKTIAEQYAYLKDVHLRIQDPSTSKFQILTRWSYIFNIVSKFVLAVILTAVGSLMIFPLLLYLATGNVEPMLPIMLPGIDESTKSGYIALQSVHAVWLACGACGFVGSDMTFIMMSLYAWPLVYLFIDHVDELNRVLVETPRLANSLQVRLFIRNIVGMHLELCDYMSNVQSFYSIIGFVDCNTNGLTMAFCAFVILVLNWLPLYAIFLLFLVKLFAICVLGTLIEMATDEVLDSIQFCEWHLLPLELQRAVHMVIIKAQHTPKLMAGTAELNLMLFVNIMKSIYSLIMLMTEMDFQI